PSDIHLMAWAATNPTSRAVSSIAHLSPSTVTTWPSVYPAKSRPGIASDDLDRIGSHPDVQLLETALELTLVRDEELSTLLGVRDVHEDTHQFIAVSLALMPPLAPNSLRLGGHGSKMLLQLDQRVRNERIRDRLAIVKPQREQEFVPAEHSAHSWPVHRRGR